MRPLTARDLDDYRRGADILARGSGSATPFTDAVLRGDRQAPCLIAPADVRGPIATIVKLGATGTTRDWAALGKDALAGLVSAADCGALAGLACGEINRSQMDRTMAVCAELDLPLVDGEHVGASAVPSLAFCRSVPAGVSLKTSYLVVDARGDTLEVVERGVVDPGTGLGAAKALDDRLRALSGAGGVVAALFLTDDLSVLHAGSVSYAMTLGRAVDLEAVLEITHGRVLCSGALTAVDAYPCVGFSVRTLHIGAHTVGVVNEFLTVDHGAERIAAVPDHIVIVDDDGRGVLTAQAERYLGRRLHVLSLPLVEPASADMIGEWRALIALWQTF